MRSNQTGNVALGLVVIALYLVAAIGWVMNLVAAVGLFVAGAPFTTMFVGRIIGIFVAPLGAILGYF